MKRLGGLAPVLLGIALCWLLTGSGSCLRDASPQLVQVSEVSPREVEVGDRIAIVGDGFPPGRGARVTFRGALHRPGERPERGVEIGADAVVAGPQQVELAFSESTQSLFCRAGDRLAHTTFEGDLEVAFAAALPGAPPIAGVLRHVTLDVRPSRGPADAERDAEGRRLLGWMGLETTTGASGLALTAVRPGSPAEAAGLVAGDTLVAAGGVRVASPGDVVPSPADRDATVVVRRAAGGELTRTVAVDGFRRAPPADLVLAGLLAFGALAVVLLLGAPTGAWPGAWIQRVASRARAGRGKGMAPTLREAMARPGPYVVLDVAACALLAAMPFGQYVVAARLDVGLIFVLAAAALAAAALLANGSAWAGARAAVHVAFQHVPAAVAVVAVVAVTGSLRVQEIAQAQGGWPWDWLAFRSPGALLALALLLLCARIEPVAGNAPEGLAAQVDGPVVPARGRPWIEAVCRAHHLLVAGLASALFLGGWLLPGLTQAEQAAHPLLQAAGAAWLFAKAWGVVLLVEWSRWALPRGRLAERSRTAALWLAPASVVALVTATAWSWWAPGRPIQLLLSGSLVSGVALAAAALVHRIRHGATSPAGDGRVSPFL